MFTYSCFNGVPSHADRVPLSILLTYLIYLFKGGEMALDDCRHFQHHRKKNTLFLEL